MKIEPSGVYHYDEEYLHENGEKIVRLAIIDAVTNLIINDQVMLQEDFDKEFLEIFLKYSLEGLPKKALVTDSYSAYPGIIEKICINHQLCIFHILNFPFLLRTGIRKPKKNFRYFFWSFFTAPSSRRFVILYLGCLWLHCGHCGGVCGNADIPSFLCVSFVFR